LRFILIATLFNTERIQTKNRLPISEGGFLAFRQHALMLAFLPYFQAKSPVFCGLDRTRTCDLADVNGAF
jgi:hypothetical protein